MATVAARAAGPATAALLLLLGASSAAAVPGLDQGRNAPSNDATPQQIHLSALGSDNADGMLVQWTTMRQQDTTAWFGTDPSNLSSSAQQTDRIMYEAGEAPGINTQWIHAAVLAPLKANTKYYYQVGDGGAPNVSAVMSFDTTPAKVFAAYGDFGLVNDRSADALIAEAQAGKFQMALHFGDFAYDLYNVNGTRGDSFMNAVQPMASIVPVQPAPGNHEEKGNFSQFLGRFDGVGKLGAGKASGSDTALWYSFDQGLAHFLSFDTEAYAYYQDPGQQQRQLNFIEQDLLKANANRDKYPWVVAMAHKAYWMVPDSPIEDLLHKYGVDVILTGHVHSYIRAPPTYNAKSGLEIDFKCVSADNATYTDPKYAVTLVAGSPGCQENIAKNLGPAGTNMVVDWAYGYGHLEPLNATHLLWQWVETSAELEDGTTGPKVKDSVTIVTHSHGMRAPQ